MAEEKEIKLLLSEEIDKVALYAQLSSKLKLKNTVIQSDHYYDNETFLFTKQDKGLRIRFVNQTPIDFTFKALFYFPNRKPSPWYVEEQTFKLPTQEIQLVQAIFERLNLTFSQKQNNELTYDDLHHLFAQNQLQPKLIIEKKRKTFLYEDAQIVWDEVKNLGTFIEIETKSSSPIRISEELELLKFGTRTIEGYTTLLARKLGLAEMKAKEPLYLENPLWNVFKQEKIIYEKLANQVAK